MIGQYPGYRLARIQVIVCKERSHFVVGWIANVGWLRQQTLLWFRVG